MVTAVRVVAQGAVFGNGRVLPQERAALLGMTAVTGIVHIGIDQQRVVTSIVRVVAIGAGHLAKTQRVTAVFECFSTRTGVA